MMVVDKLRAMSPGFRELTRGAQIIRVPFEVCPFTDEPDGKDGLWWRGWSQERQALVPMAAGEKRLDCSWWRPPFERMVIASDKDERGVMVVIARQAPGPHAHKWGAYVLLVTVVDVNGESRAAPLRVVHLFEDSDRVAISGLDEAAAIAFFTEVLTTSNLPPERLLEIARDAWSSVTDKDRSLDVENMGCVFATTCALLSCKNVTLERVHPEGGAARNSIRQRQGKLPLVSWHVLKVRGRAHSGPARAAIDKSEPLALHWVRGHFKHYTADRPLLGRAVGTYWWSPHLAGQADRVVLKDYELPKEGA